MSPDSFVIAAYFGGWEIALILAVVFILFAAKQLPALAKGLDDGISELKQELDRQAHDAGRSAGGIFGKPASEALTPDNQTAELYDPAVFKRGSKKPSLRQRLKILWQHMLAWLRITL